jgi:hypothetical protein
MRIPMVMRSKVWFSTRLIVSNPSEEMYVRRSCLLSCVGTGLLLVQRILNVCVCVCVCV